MLATLFGLATSLGLGAQQASSGLLYLFDLPKTLSTQTLIIAFITTIAIFSVYRGLDKGVKILSNLNIVLALLLLFFVIITGPTKNILSSYFSNLTFYFMDILPLSSWDRSSDKFGIMTGLFSTGHGGFHGLHL